MTEYNPLTPISASTADPVTAAADLGRRDAERELRSTTAEPDTALYVTRLRHDERVEVTSVERHLDAPIIPRGRADLHDPADFGEYVNRLGHHTHTTVWADPDAGRIVAVFDDHAGWEDAGWRSHTAVLTLKPDPDWTEWIRSDGNPGRQAWFAEHIEGLAHTVVDPDSATMLELARTFDAKRSVNFRSGVRLDSGDVQLTFEETTKAKAGEKGQLEIPYEFVIRCAPFLGVPQAELKARLRWRITEGDLSIGYALQRPDLVRRDIIAALIAELRGVIEPMPVFMGLPPAAVTPR